ncbi:lasso peptide biosynthesis PqqD family chaperone [Marinactinospora thermotolerans]|uniref:Coenzyme PQQ synthesis protein D (PqqD) n=1 Tax=Marinactinospora thermotolerans DSM 45154 TaxID=1122192 RepID=A0A1T4S679_9ACTN|nr:lasso peptide biosynthesis PqqD family chaperone [Marinactinospora thermotolerans]SKA23759.1 Coenzyme PQQ synthesis protein D (PqqD) [Marinactinospora thermotolerans DSM 45154]
MTGGTAENARALVRLHPEVSMADTDYGLVLLDRRDGRYWQLNSTGAEILRRLMDGEEVGAVAGFLAAEYEVDPAEAERDVRSLLDEIVGRGMALR